MVIFHAVDKSAAEGFILVGIAHGMNHITGLNPPFRNLPYFLNSDFVAQGIFPFA